MIVPEPSDDSVSEDTVHVPVYVPAAAFSGVVGNEMVSSSSPQDTKEKLKASLEQLNIVSQEKPYYRPYCQKADDQARALPNAS